MAYKKVTVSFAARYAAHDLLGRQTKGLNLDMIDKGMEIFETFGLAFVRTWISEKSENGKKTVPFDDVLAVKDKNVTCQVDESYLTWLNDLLKAFDWSERTIPTQAGPQVVNLQEDLGLWQCVAQLGRAVREAIAGKSIQESKE